jgi:hypothetical protein
MVLSVRLMKAKELNGPGDGEEKHARGDQNPKIGVPGTKQGH